MCVCILQIPADMVVNAMIVAMVAHANQPCDIIYHVGSSISNPVLFKDLQSFGLNYFSKNPWINKDGSPVIVGKVTVLSTMASFRRYMAIRYLIPLKVWPFPFFRKKSFILGANTELDIVAEEDWDILSFLFYI